MADHEPPLPLTRVPAPKALHFATLAGLEAAVRGLLISAMPLIVYETLGDARATSAAYFAAGVVALIWGLMVPGLTRHLPRRWTYTLGGGLYLTAMALAATGDPRLTVLAVIANAMATATTFVCFNAYVLDYVAREDLGRTQSLQMFLAATPWAVGPMLGVWLHHLWAPAPFVTAGAFTLILLATFWWLRLGNGRQITRARGPAPNPVAYLGRFLRQPRLVAGWSFAVIRSCGWWVYIVYLPIFCVQAGLGDKVGGTALSLSNAMLYASPLMLRLSRRLSVRVSVRGAFGLGALAFVAAALASPLPWATVALIMAASVCLIMLDVVGGLPFLMAVRPSERTEMSAVYSSFRDVSGILTPGVAWAVLLVAPVPAIFGVAALAFGASFLVAGALHPRLGAPRPSRGGA